MREEEGKDSLKNTEIKIKFKRPQNIQKEEGDRETGRKISKINGLRLFEILIKPTH